MTYNTKVSKGTPSLVPLPGQNDGVDHYQFDGWRDDKGNLYSSTAAAPQITVTRDIVLKAEFSAVMRTYTVNFYNDNGTFLSSQTVTHGETVTMPGAPADSGMYAGMGYYFQYWYQPNGSGAQWSVGQTVTVTSNMDVYAYFDMMNFIGP